MTPKAYSTATGVSGKYVTPAYGVTMNFHHTIDNFGTRYAAEVKAPTILRLNHPERAFEDAGATPATVRRKMVAGLSQCKGDGCEGVVYDVEADASSKLWAAIRFAIFEAAVEAGLPWTNFEEVCIKAEDAKVLPTYFGGAPSAVEVTSQANWLAPAIYLDLNSAAGPNAGSLVVDTPFKRFAWSLGRMTAVARAAAVTQRLMPWYASMSSADKGLPAPNGRGWIRKPATRGERRETMRHGHLLSGGRALLFDEVQLPTDAVDLAEDFDTTVGELKAIVGERKFVRSIPGKVDVLANRQVTGAEFEGGLLVYRVSYADRRSKTDIVSTGRGKSVQIPTPYKDEFGAWGIVVV